MMFSEGPSNCFECGVDALRVSCLYSSACIIFHHKEQGQFKGKATKTLALGLLTKDYL